MTLGFEKPRREINLGDSAELTSYVLTGQDVPINPDSILSIAYSILKPDNTTDTASGDIQGNGSGLLIYHGANQVGTYTVSAVHTFDDGRVRTDRYIFEVIDPLNPPPLTRSEQIVKATWLRFEDLFDSELGGPWLRDMSLRYFNEDKIKEFFGEAILEINAIPPATTLTMSDFSTDAPNPDKTLPDGTVDPNAAATVANAAQPIFVKALVIAVIRHLMRSYVEQPQPQGAQVVYEDRRDYLQRWGTILEMELQDWTRLTTLWKRQFYHFFQLKSLVASKAGRLYGPLYRQRGVSRGYW